MRKFWLTIKQLDRQLAQWKFVSEKYGKPREGWLKTVRKALNMSAEQLAHRLALSRSRIIQLEHAEIRDAVTLRSLREAAHALECELVYAIVPRSNSALESIIKTRAEQIAKETMRKVAHSMSLEAQSINEDILEEQKEELVKYLMEDVRKNIWNDQAIEPNGQLQNFSYKDSSKKENFVGKNKKEKQQKTRSKKQIKKSLKKK